MKNNLSSILSAILFLGFSGFVTYATLNTPPHENTPEVQSVPAPEEPSPAAAKNEIPANKAVALPTKEVTPIYVPPAIISAPIYPITENETATTTDRKWRENEDEDEYEDD